MNKIELRGVIVPSDYDNEWASEWIDKGLITPESRLRSAISAASADEPMQLYINSPGGSVFAAYEMVNALRAWKMESGQPINVTIGAMAASCASYLAIAVADQISAHANSKMMFHGAYTVTLGGKEMHADTADLLDKINADIKGILVSRYGMEPETVSEWFAEGREGWLSAEDMTTAGIADSVIENADSVIEFKPANVAAMKQGGLAIAACLDACGMADEAEGEQDEGEPEPEGESDVDTENDGEPDGGAGDEDGEPEPDNGDEPDDEPEDEPEPEPEQPDAAAERVADIEAKYAATAAAAAEKLEAIEATARKLQGERDKARADAEKLIADHAKELETLTNEHTAKIEDLTKQLAEVRSKCERLVGGGMSFSPAGENESHTASDVDPRNRLHPALR